MRPEPSLTPECCQDLKDGGALSMALGIETAAPRLQRLIDKGVSLQDMQTAIKNLSAAGIAVEAMCFTEFPTETYAEANTTVDFVGEMQDQISLFMCGRFGLCHGSRGAHFPEDYGIQKIWRLQGDERKYRIDLLMQRNTSSALRDSKSFTPWCIVRPPRQQGSLLRQAHCPL